MMEGITPIGVGVFLQDLRIFLVETQYFASPVCKSNMKERFKDGRKKSAKLL